ncbi:MAG: PAS domain S-box protein [Actinomycetota bacterium]|nr:PAS domain S-box protein [Actinomycetota bacterium]
MFDRAAVGMALVDFGGRFLRVNKALCTLLGRSQRELLATTWPAVTHPDDRAIGQEHAARMQRGEEEAFQFEKRYVRPDGTHVTAMLTVSLIRDATGEPSYMFTQVVDLTHHRNVENARNRLAAIADVSEDAIIGTTLDGEITAWNKGAESIYGYRADEVIGSDIFRLVPEDCREGLRRDMARVHRLGRVFLAEALCTPKHGSAVDVSVKVMPLLDASAQVQGIAFIARDMTEQRWLARTLDSTLVALEEALHQARELEAQSRRFLADAAHQLRTPIAGVQACAETLLRGQSKEQTDFILMHLLRETSRASRLMNSLLRIARLDQGEQLTPKPCNLAALCADEADRARTLAPALHITSVVGDMEHDHPPIDSHATREILANLLDNARRYATTTIEVLVRQCDGVVRIEVFDDGPGLADDMVERAFERFVSLDDKAGSGLGLPIARELARAHGGDLTYEDGRFVVTLAATPMDAQRVRTKPTARRRNTAALRSPTYTRGGPEDEA